MFLNYDTNIKLGQYILKVCIQKEDLKDWLIGSQCWTNIKSVDLPYNNHAK